MKKLTLKVLSLAIALVFVFSCLSTAIAAQGAEIAKITHMKGRNNVSASYAAGKYYKQLTSMPYTEDNVTDLIAVALSQLGYMESDSADDFSGETAGSDNYTEFNYNMGDFGVGYGSSNYDWCASFVSFCLLQSRSTTQSSMSDWCRNHVADQNSNKYDPNYADYVWREVGCQRWADNLISAGYYEKSMANGGTYVPKSGDLIFYRWSPNKSIGHIGIVVYSDGERVYTVEGNTSGGSTMVSNGGGVYFKSYELDYSCIDGYGKLPYVSKDGVEKIDYSGKNATTGLYVTTVDKSLYVKASVESEYVTIPAYTIVKVVEVVEEGIGGMLRAVCEVNGEKVQGYVVNSSSERIVQISNVIPEPVPESFLTFDKTDGYLAGEIEGYTLNGEAVEKETTIKITETGKIALNATLDFESDVIRCGYFLDGKRTAIEWLDGGINNGDDESVQECEIAVDISELSAGKHSITFVVELENMVIPIIDTLEFDFEEASKAEEEEEKKENEEEDNDEPAQKDTDVSTEPVVIDKVTEKATESEQTEDIEEIGCNGLINGTAVIASIIFGAALLPKRKDE